MKLLHIAKRVVSPRLNSCQRRYLFDLKIRPEPDRGEADLRMVIPLFALWEQQMCRRAPVDQISTSGGLVLSPAVLSIRPTTTSTLSKPLKALWRSVWRTLWKDSTDSSSPWGVQIWFIRVNAWLKWWQGAGHEVSYCFSRVGCVVVCRMHASGSHLKKCSPFPWINEQLGRTGQGGAICKCHRHCLLILHIIKANIPNLYQSNQEQAITATGAPGEPRPNSERKEQWGRERLNTLLSIYLTHTHTPLHTFTCVRSNRQRAQLPAMNKHVKSAPTSPC